MVVHFNDMLFVIELDSIDCSVQSISIDGETNEDKAWAIMDEQGITIEALTKAYLDYEDESRQGV